MKRCPTCNQTFSEGWLSFCTQDGTTLVEDSVSRSEPPPTIMSAPPVTNPNNPANWTAPLAGAGPGPFPERQPLYQQPQPIQAGWQPPPAGPTYVRFQQQGVAVASLICGIFTITIGWCCYLGVISGPIAIGLGIYSLVQIKNNPAKFGGKPFAITGIVTAALYFLGIAAVILIWGVAAMMQGVK